MVVFFICLGAYLASARRRVPGVVFLAVLLLALAGCGGGSGSSTSGTSKVQPAASQTYTVTVIGSRGTEQEFAQVIVTVK